MVLDLRRKFSALLAALLVFSLFSPGVALADSWYMGLQKVYVNDNASSFDSVVVAPNQYAAAAYVMGAEPQLLTEEQKNILSDGLFCPNFCQYAASFQEFDPLAPPDWLPQYVYASLVVSGIGVSALGNKRYVSSASNFLFQDAKEELQAVLSGDVPGGGGSSGGSSSGPELVLTCSDSGVTKRPSSPIALQVNGVDYYVNEQIVDGTTYSRYAPDITLKLVGDALTTYNNLMEQNDNLKLYFFSNYGSRLSGILVLTDAELSTNDLTGRDGVTSFSYKEYSFGTGDFYTLNGSDFGTNYSFTDNNDGTFSTNTRFRYMGGSKRRLYSPTNNGWNTYTSVGGSSSAPPDPSGDWPDDPVTPSPTPPPLPDPGTNTFPTEPTETDISVNLPDINVTVGGSATDLTDVISILKVINGNLVTINDNLEDEFNSVINAFNAIGGQIEQLAQRIREHCIHIRQAIYQNTTHLENEIYKLFHWLEEQFDFSFTGYDDSSVLSYLRRILDKLGNPTKPDYQPNPIADEDNFFDWLLDLWHRFLIDLASILPESMLGLLDLFSQLTHYFPISIPWDIAAMLALFVHDPVIPVFDLPMPFAVGQTASIHIDLTPWDGVAQMVRPVFLVMFCFALAMETKKLLSHVNVTEGGI